jgi:hypothetical protein
VIRRLTSAVGAGRFAAPMTEPRACTRCRHALGPEMPSFPDDAGRHLCVPCAMGLALPGRQAGPEGAAPPRYAVPAAVAAAVQAEIDLGTGRSWAVEVEEFSVEGLRLSAPVAFGAGTPAVVVLRDRTGADRPAVFAVEVRWVRGGPDGRVLIGTRVIAAVDGHHAAFLGRVLQRVATRATAR